MIERIDIHNVRSFRQLAIEPSVTQTGGQWIIVLGDNGAGKSTFLRGMALTLVDQESATTILHGRNNTSFYIRKGAESGTVAVKVSSGRYLNNLFQAHFTRNHAGVDSPESVDVSKGYRPFIAGYGSQRGSALGRLRRSEWDREHHAVWTLFDESVGLIDVEEWLMGLDYAARSDEAEGIDKHMLQSTLSGLRSVLPNVEKISVSPRGVRVETRDGSIPLSDLSDGYLTTIGWVVDMMARWSEKASRTYDGWDLNELGEFDLKTMTGIVLVDEIDLHLHPKWQTQIIPLLRAAFPNMTFVVTTHSPLTVLSARPGELYVLERQEDGSVAAVQRDIKPGMDVDQILTGEWFDLSSTTDPGTLDLLQFHATLVREGVPVDAPERQEIERELRRRLGGFRETSVERLADSVAAEVIDGDLRELSANEREQARAKIMEAVQQRRTSA